MVSKVKYKTVKYETIKGIFPHISKIKINGIIKNDIKKKI